VAKEKEKKQIEASRLLVLEKKGMGGEGQKNRTEKKNTGRRRRLRKVPPKMKKDSDSSSFGQSATI